MGLYIQLHLLGLMLITKIYDFNRVDHPILSKVLESLGIISDTPMDEKDVRNCFFVILSSLEDRFAYYDSCEMKTNFTLAQYLNDVFNDFKNGTYERSKTLAVAICGMGNKGGPMEYPDAVSTFLEEAHHMLGKLAKFYMGEEDLPVEIFQAYIRRLEYIEKVLELTDVYVTSRLGAEMGLPEYPPVNEDDLDEIPDPDFNVDGLECKGDGDCGCGCAMDHPLQVIQGMEDFLNGVESPAKEYFIGVAGANNIRLEGYAGNEGPVFDAIKELGSKAWDALTASLRAIKEMFSTSDPEKKVEAATEAADNNKKALQAMKDTGAVINDKARAGIQQLAETIDPSGKMKNLVSQLRTPKDAPKVIDALLGFMAKEATNSGAVGKQLDAASTSISDLKAATNDASGDEANKDVVAAKKAKVNDKVKGGKEAIKEVKFELAAHSKLMAGIQKAIAGISPKIFIKADNGDKKDDE